MQAELLLLATLAELDEGMGVALTRLAKRLDTRVSLLMRSCTELSDAQLGTANGPGWVRLHCDEAGRWSAQLTELGRAQLTRPIQPMQVWRADGSAPRDQVAVETPVALVFNGISHAVMMATPSELEGFALGFALSEGLLETRAECYGIDIVHGTAGCEVRLEVAAAAEMRLKERRRNLVGRTGCGLCGIDSLQQLDLAPAPIAAPDWLAGLDAGIVSHAIAQLPALQPLNTLTGAHHAAGWADPQGRLLAVMEDVGRHNALDKLLGQRALDKLPFDEGFVVISSRASYELLRKCARLGVPALAAISAPTSLAVDIARRAGMQLYGFCRGEQATRY